MICGGKGLRGSRELDSLLAVIGYGSWDIRYINTGRLEKGAELMDSANRTIVS